MTWAGVRLKPDLVHANDLIALPIGYVVARLTKAKLIYDSHELWSDPFLSPVPKWLSKVPTFMEKFLARRADAVITVNDSIARIMSERMEIPAPTVIRNLPQCMSQLETHESVLHRSLGLMPDCPVILYIGGLTYGRGLETFIDAMSLVSPPAVAVLMGPHEGPDYFDKLRCRVLDANLQERVRFHAPVASDEVGRYASNATIGICPIEDSHLSYRYSLPNKIFECLQAGLPVVVTDLPEMSNLVRRYGVGETFPDGDSKALADILNRMLSSPAALAEYRVRVAAAAGQLNWSHEEPKLLSIYDKLCSAGAQVPILRTDDYAPDEVIRTGGKN
jgi:glycosyltransferase involved in cell wall biosynthesis